MSDEADLTSERMELEAEIQRKYSNKQALQEYAPTGFCLNCGDKVPEGFRWCDVSCRNDHQARQRK